MYNVRLDIQVDPGAKVSIDGETEGNGVASKTTLESQKAHEFD